MPIFHWDVEQGTPAWDALRLGIPTSSNFNMLITPIERRVSKQWVALAYHLISERVLLRKVEGYTSPAMERGRVVQNQASDWYELDQDVDVQRVGFVSSDDYYEDVRGRKWSRFGCSPDGLVGKNGMVEFKCPTPPVQMRYFIEQEPEKEHWSQLQGQLFVCKREWVDILAWHEEMAKVVVRVERDDLFIDLLEMQLRRMNEYMDGIMDKIGETNLRQAPRQELRRMLEVSVATTPAP